MYFHVGVGKVCGTPVILNKDQDYDLATAYLTPIDDEVQIKSKSVLNKIAIRNGAKITSRWKHPIHARSAREKIDIDLI